MAIPVKLPVFEGPLDLLMHLIEKNKIDIYDIPIVEITDQYLEYVHQMDHEDMDVTSEFLVMAATLLDIKSRMLLPREKDEETGEEEGDPREELVRRLLEYKMYKYMSEELAVCREQAGVRYFRAQDLPKEVRTYQPPIDYEDLLKGTDLKKLEKVFGEVLRRKKSRRDPIRSGFGKIRREEVNIDTKTLYIRAYLQAHPRTEFRALLESQESKEEVIVTFLILLELMKNQKVHIVQDSICGKILIESSETGAENTPIPAETPSDEVPADEGPASEPSVPEAPAEDALVDEVPVDEALVDELPVDEASADELPAPEAPADEALVDEVPMDVALVEETPLVESFADELPVDEAAALDAVITEAPEEKKAPPKDPVEQDTESMHADSPEEDFSGISSLSLRSWIEVVSPLLPFVPELPPSAGEYGLSDAPASEDFLPENEDSVTDLLLQEDEDPVTDFVPAENEDPVTDLVTADDEDPGTDLLLQENENPVTDLVPEEEKVSVQELYPVHFSAHLWYGRVPGHVSPLCDFKYGSVRALKAGGQSFSRRLRRDDPVWEQTRLSRLWARRL